MQLLTFKSLFSLSLLALSSVIQAYPLDGYQDTGIRRVEGARLANEGIIHDSIRQVPGALWTTEQVDIRLLDHKDLQIPEPDPQLTQQIKNITRKTTVSVLEIGGSLQTADYYQHPPNSSVFSNQPKNIKDGLSKGTRSFTDGMTTIVTFITDENADLFQLPSVLVKPFAGFLANTFLGVCNQIDPERYQRMQDKYK